jgi:antitoxin CptB
VAGQALVPRNFDGWRAPGDWSDGCAGRLKMSALKAAFNQEPEGQFEIRCRRLLFRSWNRGTQESDLILGTFAETSLASFDGIQLDRLEALLDCSDPDLFDWIFGVTAPPAQHDHDVMRLLRDFCVARKIIPQAQ